MVKFVEVDPASIDTNRLGRRGRVSYPIIKGFLESNAKMVKLTDMPDKNPAYMRSVLYSYIRSHKLPVKIFQAGGEMYLMRLDMDNEGKINENWMWEEETTEGNVGALRNEPAGPITAAEVVKRSTIESYTTTK